ncbi:FMN-dependent NADH-azoreductase [Kitasatospora cathayae]|uniref:FMN dependent NADH:quinone oxidoreductase n=1 Tax=Kitasatospora cathayae TaxID=3004092 RepID=A0ABY7Q6I7_9ACTN|nr:NAD(P)H-dependent oxidoreductase [Kitasatospora sp. HUAS 3-15]WBP87891.1 NAD(P)H-dependent oxidoreductase [Kitasatospora sp. HUAS 3-15]
MPTLLHIDSSALADGSVSREVTAAFLAAWQAEHPDGTVIRRDLAAEPVPHLDAHGIAAGFTPAEARTAEQSDAFALREQLMVELESADAVLIGTPMYNFTIPSTLKAWLDHVILMGRTAGEEPSAKGTPVTVVASRGGSYAPGAPREPYEFVTTYLEKVLTGMLGLEVDFIVPEFTLAASVPAMADFIPAAAESKARALEQAVRRAKELAGRAAV